MIYIDNPSPAAARNKTYDCYFYSLCPDYTVNNLFNLAKDVGFNVKYIQDLNKYIIKNMEKVRHIATEIEDNIRPYLQKKSTTKT